MNLFCSNSNHSNLSALELCAGGGGQALGLEAAGFDCAAAVEIDPHACSTLRLNRPDLRVIEDDIQNISGYDFKDIDLISGGVPCPPFSIAGKQLGANDERDLFPEAVRIIQESKPRALLLENVPGFANARFDSYRQKLLHQLKELGYEVGWRILQSSHFGVPQLRPRFLLVGLRNEYSDYFRWPVPEATAAPTVGDTLYDLMAENSWPGAIKWKMKANDVGPTLVGGSKKHGGPDLGPTRAKAQWRLLGVDGMGIADAPPAPDFPIDGLPRLTIRMVARIQSFPDSWKIFGRKTAAYRQLGNAFPPLVAKAITLAIRRALEKTDPHKYPEMSELVSGLVSDPMTTQ